MAVSAAASAKTGVRRMGRSIGFRIDDNAQAPCGFTAGCATDGRLTQPRGTLLRMSTAPHFDIDPADFWRDPYPALARLRREAPIAFVPQLGSTLFTRRDDIFVSEKQIDVFSSHQPNGLMNKLMGHNMMRKDGDAHLAERKAIFPSVSPKTVKGALDARSSRRMPTASWTSWRRPAAPTW